MANHKSALKRHRQNVKRREQNRNAKSAIRTSVKTAIQYAKTGKAEEAMLEAKKATSLLDKAVVHGVIHKNTAQRTISRLHKGVAASHSA